jgi:ubiquitin carboxyl-terminal hydrolase 1
LELCVFHKHILKIIKLHRGKNVCPAFTKSVRDGFEMPSSSRTYHSPPQYAYPQQSDPNISATAVLSCAFAGVFVIYYILSGILALPSLTDIVVLMAGLLFGPAAREYLQSTFATSPRQVVSQVRNRAASIVGRSATLSHSGGTVGGLWNVGNTCYQNSVLQALASLDSLKPWLVSIEDGTAAAALARLVADLNLIKDKPRAATADTLITQESGGTRGWMFNEQQDAQEFLQGLMGVLEKEVSREMDKRKKENTIGLEGILGGRKKNSTVSPLDANLRSPFEGLLAQRVGCLRCGYVESISLQPFTTLSLPIPSTWATTLEDCLRVFTSIENIPEVDCDKCTLQAVRQRLQNILDSPPPPGFENLFSDISDVNYPAFKDTLTVRLDAVSAALEEDNFTARIPGVRLDGVHKVSSTKTKQVMVARAPQVLVLHTNRSQFDILTGMVGKNYAAVRFPALLDLGELDVVTRHEMLSVNPGNPISSVHLLGDDSATAIIDNVVYYLKAVVAHYGGHHNGHYVAYRSWAGKWWRISDHEVM